jgi:hypothetical protein
MTSKQNSKLLAKRPLPRTGRFLVIGLIALLLVYSLANVYLAYRAPTTQQQNEPIIQYINTGSFSYLVYLNNNTVYNKTILRPGEGVYYSQLVNHINATFTYTFEVDDTAHINGTTSVQAIIQTTQWTKTYTLVPQTPFTSTGQHATAMVSFPINTTRYEQILTKINQETGVPAVNPLLIIQSVVTVQASTSKGIVYSSFLPNINISLGQRTIDFSKILVTSEPGFLTGTKTVEVPGIYAQRSNWSIASILIFLGLLGFMLLTIGTIEEETETKTQIKKIMKKYSDWIVEADPQPDATKMRIIALKSIEDLAKIGEELGKPMVHYTTKTQNEEAHMFFIIDESVFYEFELKSDGKIRITASCPQWEKEIVYEDYPGQKINAICPNCGNKSIASIQKTKKKTRWSTFFSRSAKPKAHEEEIKDEKK